MAQCASNCCLVYECFVVVMECSFEFPLRMKMMHMDECDKWLFKALSAFIALKYSVAKIRVSQCQRMHESSTFVHLK